MTAEQKTKMGQAGRLPKGIRKHIREAKARIWAEHEDPEMRARKLKEVYANLGYADAEKAKKNREKAAKRRPKKGRKSKEAAAARA